MVAKRAPVGPPRTANAAEADRHSRLIELRDRLHEAMNGAVPRDLAALALRYQSVLAELAAMPDMSEVDGVDDLAARRSARRNARGPVTPNP